MLEQMGLAPWQAFLLWPGAVAMDWLAVTWPGFVIRTGIGFGAESYMFWVGLLSTLFWLAVLGGLSVGIRAGRARFFGKRA